MTNGGTRKRGAFPDGGTARTDGRVCDERPSDGERQVIFVVFSGFGSLDGKDQESKYTAIVWRSQEHPFSGTSSDTKSDTFTKK